MARSVERVNLTIEDRSHYEAKISVWADAEKSIPVYILNYTAQMEFRDRPGGTLLFSASTSDYLTVGESFVTISIPSAIVTAWNFTSAQYDLFVISQTGKPSKVARGAVVVVPTITEV
jgi:hypothetical protein